MKPRFSQHPPVQRCLAVILACCLALLSAPTFAATSDPPPGPELQSAAAGDEQVRLSWLAWTPPQGYTVTGYNVYRSTAPNVASNAGTPIGTTRDTTFTDKTLTNGTSYYYIVAALYAFTPEPGTRTGRSFRSQASRELSATPHKGSHNDTGEIVGGVLIIGAIAAILAGGHGHAPPRNSAEDLRENGPRFPEGTFNMSHFDVHGFIKGGWPMVVDYALDAPAEVKVTVTANGSSFVYPLEGTQTGEQQVKFFLSDSFGSALQVGTITISAEDLSGQGNPQKLTVYAIGAGPTAVGSVTVDQITFAPRTIRVKQKESTQYRFHALRDFWRSAVDFYRLTVEDQGVEAINVKSQKCVNLVEGHWYGPSKKMGWDGKDDHKKPSPGLHMMQVRGWTDPKTDGSWLAAAPPDMVTVLGD